MFGSGFILVSDFIIFIIFYKDKKQTTETNKTTPHSKEQQGDMKYSGRFCGPQRLDFNFHASVPESVSSVSAHVCAVLSHVRVAAVVPGHVTRPRDSPTGKAIKHSEATSFGGLK